MGRVQILYSVLVVLSLSTFKGLIWQLLYILSHLELFVTKTALINNHPEL